jgi:two-component system, chemotaxis family, protein-glutamate methylesterase/glutaminase
MSVQHVVVIGASAGGVEALLTLARELRPDLPAAICVVLHQPRNVPSVLPRLMTRAGALTVVHAEDGMALQEGQVYLAPANRHLLVERDHVRVDRGPLENGHRPAVDPLFRSAAQAYGSEVTAVVLSGSLDDGSAGCVAVKQRGGSVVVQDPDEALYAEMPNNAARAIGGADEVVSIHELAGVLDRLRGGVTNPGGSEQASARRDPSDPDGSATRPPVQEDPVQHQSLSCPSCGGSLHEQQDGPAETLHASRWRCRVGHGWSLESLFADHGQTAEAALWAATRVLEERAALCRRLRDRAEHRGQQRAVVSFNRQAQDAERHARSIRASIDALTPHLGQVASDEDLALPG